MTDWQEVNFQYSLSRRNFLGATGGLLGLSLNDPVRNDPILSSLGTNDTQPNITPTPFSDDPFIIPSYGTRYIASYGDWGDESLEDKLRTILTLHPDAYFTRNFGPLRLRDGEVALGSVLTAQRDLARRAELPVTAPRNTTIELEEEENRFEWEPIFESHDWTLPNGEPLTDPFDAIAETFGGEMHRVGFGNIPSAYSPTSPEIIYTWAEGVLSQGFSGILVDGPATKAFNGLDFSIWATDAFTDHLASLPPERRSELGVEDPSNFDIKSHIKSNNLTPHSGNDPREDPVFQEYVIHHHLGIKNYLLKLRERLHERFPDRMSNDEIAMFSNQFMGSLTNPQSPVIYLSDHVDLIFIEHDDFVQPANDYKYKIAKALGRFSKSVVNKNYIDVDKPHKDFEMDRLYPMFQRFRTAEAYAHGIRHELPLPARSSDEILTQWVDADGNVPDKLKSFIDFLWAHRRYLEDVDPDNPVAVVWSLPDRMFRRLPQWNIGETPEGVESFLGTVERLRETQHPYDVIVFGHPRLWDDTDQLERIGNYEAIILPNIKAITEAQLNRLANYLDAGGVVISSGPPPERTGMWADRVGAPEIFDHQNVVVLDEDPGRQRETKGSSNGNLVKSLSEHGISSYTTGTDPTITINHTTQLDDAVSIVHILNHDYDPSSDTFDAKTDLTIEVPSPDHEVNAVRYYSPQEITELSYKEQNGTLRISVPQCIEWGFVVVTNESDGLTEGSPESARSKTTKAAQLLSEAHHADREWSSEIVIVDMKTEAAEIALEYNAYRQAATAAQEALDAAAKTQPVPLVGIDQAHGQPESQEADNPFASLRENVPNYDYGELTDWQETSLENLDVLIIPPALAFKGASYGFTSSELDRIESFVENGGSLAIMIRGGASTEIDDLTERFGYEYNLNPVVFPDGTEYHARSADVVADHEVTRDITHVHASLAAPIAEYPENATILAAIPDESDAWLHKGGELRVRNGNEPSAAGRPIYAVSQHGDGHVAVLGTARYLGGDNMNIEEREIMRNLLEYLSENARTDDMNSLLELYEAESSIVEQYDKNGNSEIEIGELADAAADYAAGKIPISELAKIASAYASS